MDPQACLQRFLDALTDNNAEEAEDSLNDLLDWVQKGGWLPSLPVSIDGTV